MRVLLGIDGSANAAVACKLVADLPLPPDSVVTVVNAIERQPELVAGPWPMYVNEPESLERTLRSDATRIVDEAAHALAGPGRIIETSVRRGRPASVIVDAARDFRSDLVVVGNRGLSGVESLLVGSVSSEVVDHSPAPVLVARGAAMRRILVAVDGSPMSNLAVELLRIWPIFRGAQIRVVSVARTPYPWWSSVADTGGIDARFYRDSLEQAERAGHEVALEAAAELRQAGLDADEQVIDGDPGHEIVLLAERWAADLVVVGSHAYTAIHRLLIGSVARHVLHHAHASVLVVREGVAVAREPASAGVHAAASVR
ncbi:MAG TPA: universal stress protein [Candidatus Limnocylindrales bacterium]|nr:universal stress protein [Candidatus Limnocylindrales bacterium]